jgi:hypothetical protein
MSDKPKTTNENGFGTDTVLLTCSCLAVIIGGIAFLIALGFLGFLQGENTGTSTAGNINVPEAGQCIDEYIKSKSPTSPLIGQGITFASAGNARGISPALLVAIAGQESTYATSWAAIPKETKNFASLTCGCTQKSPCVKKSTSSNSRTWESYMSWEDAITREATYLKRKFFDKGITEVKDIGAIYCPGCSDWVKNVSKIKNELENKCLLSGAGSPSPQCGAAIISQASKYSGIAYSQNWHCGPSTFGPSGILATDCSGLASRVYRDVGLAEKGWCIATADLRSNSGSVRKYLIEITASQVATGDLISSGSGDTGHVVIFVSGNPLGRFYVWQSGGGGSSRVRYGSRNAKSNQQYWRAKKCQNYKTSINLILAQVIPLYNIELDI